MIKARCLAAFGLLSLSGKSLVLIGAAALRQDRIACRRIAMTRQAAPLSSIIAMLDALAKLPCCQLSIMASSLRQS